MAAHRDSVIVTTAAMSGTEDRRLRQRRYLITQVVRITCFLLAVWLPVPLWAKLLLIAGAFTLPWLGVVAANGGPTLERRRAMSVVPPGEQTAPVPLDPSRTIDQK